MIMGIKILQIPTILFSLFCKKYFLKLKNGNKNKR